MNRRGLPTREELRLDQKEALFITLETARRAICCYAGDPCDCKYGRRPDTQAPASEQTGCPELRDLIVLLTGWFPYNRHQSVEDAAMAHRLKEEAEGREGVES